MMIVRDTIDGDIDPIFALRRHPLVLAQQFHPTLDDTPDNWRMWLAGKNLVNCFVFRCTTILLDNQVVGHISQRGSQLHGITTFNIGFNLLPAYWGRGLMSNALLSVIPELFADHSAEHIVAACFRGNHRSKRLITSLGFQPFHVPVAHRVYIAYKMACLRWIHFRYLDSERWSEMTENH